MKFVMRMRCPTSLDATIARLEEQGMNDADIRLAYETAMGYMRYGESMEVEFDTENDTARVLRLI